MMKKSCVAALCLTLCLSLLLPWGAGASSAFESYWAYCNKEFVHFAKSQPRGGFVNALQYGQVVEVVGQEGGMLKVICRTSSGDEKLAWLWADDLSLIGDREGWRKLSLVNNPNPEDRLNLRTKPDKQASSLGKYYNGVAVVALEAPRDGWVKVRIDVRTGYMQAKYLLALDQSDGLVSALPNLMIDSTTKGGVSLRVFPWKEASNLGRHQNGEYVRALGVTAGWYHVEAPDGFTGFMPDSSFDRKLR